MEKNRCINDEEFAQQAIDVPAAADRVRLVALDHAAVLANAKERSLRRELAIQKARLGSDAPQVRVLAERVRLQQVLRVQTAAEIERSETVAPERQSGIFVLHGRVVDRQHLGQAGLTVSAVDRSGRPQTYTCTDGRGYFKMEIAVKEGAPQSELFLLVSKDGAVLYRGSEAHSVVSEGIVYREIVLGEEAPEPPCPPPPEPQPDRVRVPDVVERTEAQAQELLKAAGLSIGERTTKPAPNQVGLVLAQSPKAGSEVAIGSPVDLVIGTDVLVAVPDVVGKPEKQAVELIKAARLSIGERTTKPAPNQVGLVLVQSPKAGSEVAIGSSVDLVIGTADLVGVPDVVGKPEAQALEMLKAARLSIGERTTRPAPNQVGLVLAQSPKGGAQVPVGTAIDLTIGVARLVTVPNVIGLKVEAARETIARAGLAFGVARERESDRPGLVLEQDREGGKELPAGTLVNVVVGRAR